MKVSAPRVWTSKVFFVSPRRKSSSSSKDNRIAGVIYLAAVRSVPEVALAGGGLLASKLAAMTSIVPRRLAREREGRDLIHLTMSMGPTQ